MNIFVMFGIGLGVLVAALPAVAQTYPSKAVRMILPFPPGGPTDLLGRAIAQKMSDQMGQQVVADNRPGAGGNLGLDLTAKSPADGYTIVLTSPLIALGPLLRRSRDGAHTPPTPARFGLAEMPG